DGLAQGGDGFVVAPGLVEQLAAQRQVAGLGAAGRGEIAVEHRQRLVGLLVLGVQLGQHQHGLQVVVVVQRVILDRLGDVALGALGVIQVVGRVAREVGRIGAVVIVGALLGDDVLGALDHQRVVAVVHGLVEAVQALGHAAGGAFGRRFAGGVGIALFDFLLLAGAGVGATGAAAAALALRGLRLGPRHDGAGVGGLGARGHGTGG